MNPALQSAEWALRRVPNRCANEGLAAVALSGEPLARWSLQRRCALTPGQFLSALSVVALASVAIGGFFWVQGVAWVALFSGLELALVALAFLWHGLHAADGELLCLYPHGLYVERRTGLRLQRHWLARGSLRVVEQADGGLCLRAARAQLNLGQRATAADRRRVAHELRQALEAGAAH